MANMQVVIFKLNDEAYGVNISNVNAIEHNQEIVRVPNSSGNIKGIINLRGEVIPVVDLKAKFNSTITAASENDELIIVHNQNRKIALEVDGVEKIYNLTDAEIVEMPTVAKGEDVDYFTKVAKVDGKLVIIIDSEKLLSESESSVVENLVNA